jgi:hypothetical protein
MLPNGRRHIPGFDYRVTSAHLRAVKRPNAEVASVLDGNAGQAGDRILRCLLQFFGRIGDCWLALLLYRQFAYKKNIETTMIAEKPQAIVFILDSPSVLTQLSKCLGATRGWRADWAMLTWQASYVRGNKWRDVGFSLECRLYRSNEMGFHLRREDIS